MTLEDHLHANALNYPQKVAVVSQGISTTYSQLYGLVEERVKQLYASGIGKGSIVCFRTSQDLDFLVHYFAIHKAGAVAVPLEKDMPAEKFQAVEQQYSSFTPPEGVADILYTTGTTGEQKGVMVSHDTIMADAENLIAGQGFSHDLLFVICGPLNHIGSLSKIYPVITLGATLYITEGMKNLEDFFNALDYPCQKAATFLVPASVRILLQLAGKRLRSYASKIDFIESGAAPMPHSDMLALCEALPHTRLYNTYASTETGIICTYNYNDGRCLAGCLGKPMPNSEVFITSEGHVACKGGTLMTGYAADETRTREVLRDGTVFTADNGMIDGEGMLHLLGRDDDVINVGGFKVAPTEVEDAAMSFDGISDCICISVPSPITGQALKLLYVSPAETPLSKRDMARHIQKKVEIYKVPLLYEKVDKIARTYNGKLDRKHYREK